LARQAQASRNQRSFRELNERIAGAGPAAALVEFICECANGECEARVSLTVGEYESVRLIATRFLVVPGHVLVEVERVVELTDRFAVVEKFGAVALVPVENDPRAELPVSAPDRLVAENEALREEAGQLRQALESRILIEQAKGALCVLLDTDPTEAFELLRRGARSDRMDIHELADQVVQGRAVPAAVVAELARGRKRANLVGGL
jgi:hypothetical protein